MGLSADPTTGEIYPVSLGPLAVSLAKAQMAFPAITKSKTVRVTTKTGGSYTFDYAPLETILDAVRKPLADNGLVISQLIDRDTLVTVLLHESGATLEGHASLPASSDVQGYGSAVTYLRRYAIQALLGIAAEEDDDGNHAAGNHADPTPRRAPSAAQTGDRKSDTAPTPTPRAENTAATSVAGTQDGNLSEDDWAGLIDEAAPAKPTALSSGVGLSSRDFFTRTDDAGIDRKDVTNTAKKMFGASKWKVTDLSDEERAALWHELEPVAA